MSLCRKCNFWVDCGSKGFCLMRDLFTYTDESECQDYAEGEPLKEKEYEEVNKKMDAGIKEKVYISGAITGVLDYADKFNKAEQELRSMGFDVFNPCNMGIVEGFSWSDYMKKDIAMLMECDYIFPLKDWRKSRGAKIEMKLAKKLGIEVLKL